MNIAVVENAEDFERRISETISGLENMRVLCEVTEIAEVEGYTGHNHIDVLIADTPHDQTSARELLSTLKRKHPTMVTIMLSIEPLALNHQAWQAFGAEFLLDKAAGLAVLPDLLRWIQRQLEYAVLGVPFANTNNNDWFTGKSEQI